MQPSYSILFAKHVLSVWTHSKTCGQGAGVGEAWPRDRGVLGSSQVYLSCCGDITKLFRRSYSSLQFSHSVVSNSLWLHESQHARPPCPSPTPEFPQTHVHHVVMPSSHLILGRPLLLLPPIPPSIKVFSNESTLHMRWPNIGVSASASFLAKNTQGWSPLEWTCWISLQSKGLSRVFSNTTVQKHQFFGAQLSLQSNSHIHTWPLEIP